MRKTTFATSSGPTELKILDVFANAKNIGTMAGRGNGPVQWPEPHKQVTKIEAFVRPSSSDYKVHRSLKSSGFYFLLRIDTLHIRSASKHDELWDTSLATRRDSSMCDDIDVDRFL